MHRWCLRSPTRVKDRRRWVVPTMNDYCRNFTNREGFLKGDCDSSIVLWFRVPMVKDFLIHANSSGFVYLLHTRDEEEWMLVLFPSKVISEKKVIVGTKEWGWSGIQMKRYDGLNIFSYFILVFSICLNLCFNYKIIDK